MKWGTATGSMTNVISQPTFDFGMEVMGRSEADQTRPAADI